MTKKNPASAPRAVLYARVSTDKQADDGVSLEMQLTRLRAYCEMRGIEVVEVVMDPAQSAFTPLAKRRQGKRVLDLIRARKVDAVVALKLDRLFRSVKDCSNLMDDWKNQNVALHLVDMGVDTSSAAGQMFLHMLSAFAQFERSLASERTRAALAHKFAKGDHRMGGDAPYGYQYSGRKLVENYDEQCIIQFASVLRMQGQSFGDIAKAMQQRGFRNRAGEAFARQSIHQMLKPPKRLAGAA